MKNSFICPDQIDDVCDLYVLNRLTAEEMEEFETHVLLCERCLNAVEAALELVAALRAAVGEPAGVGYARSAGSL